MDRKTLAQRDREVTWHPYTQMQTAPLPIPIVRAEGTLLYDEEGNTYVDAISSWWVNTFGHSHPHIVQRVTKQLQELDHVLFAGFTHRPAVELAEKLLAILPPNHKRVFFSDNGSTAVEVALKMALQYWDNLGLPKTKIVAFRDSYHGDTFGAMSVSSRSAFTRPFSSLLFDVSFIDVPVPGQEQAALDQLEEICRTGEVAAFIFEPLVLGTAGMVMYAPAVLENLLTRCRQHDVLTIADEVMTGFGRTGKNFACDHLSTPPDLMCFSKGLTGGTMALGLTTSTDQLYRAFLSGDKTKTFYHGHSYTANPLACSAAVASVELLQAEKYQVRVREITIRNQAFVERVASLPGIKAARSCGTIAAVEFEAGQTSYFNSLRDRLYAYALERGVLLRPLGNIVYLLPPYSVTDEELEKIYAVILGMREMVNE
ncbi:adenosylmethionine--8-amino-7-oxononanoate transaminase [soil metagenome]